MSSMPFARRGIALVIGPILAVLLATTVATGHGSRAPRLAYGTFIDATGAEIGSVRLSEDRHGIVHVHVRVKGLSTGLHGIHIHAIASCTAPTFASAGGHYNPFVRQHGLENPSGPHAGDLPNLVVGARGHGRLHARTDRVTLRPGLATLLDGDGSAFIIHANPDDQVNDVGNGGSGARIACAVIIAGRWSPGHPEPRG
jgi:Cu-Zn family superoxide dismutase